MAEDFVAGQTPLEEDGPAPVAEAPAVAAVAEAPAPVAEEAEIDPNAVDLKDEGRVRALLAELSKTRGEKRDLKVKAEKADQLEQQLAQIRPYAEFLQANPDLLRPKPPDPVPAQPVDDPDALEAAKLMDFYTPEGKHDVAKGAAWLRLQDRRSQRMAQEAVQPWAQQSIQERANTNFMRALQTQMPNGQKPHPQTLQAIWQRVGSTPDGLRSLADPNQAAFFAATAVGLAPAVAPAVAAPGQPPIHTEASGGVTRTARRSLSELESRVASHRGKDPDAFGKLTDGFRQGRNNVLED